MKPSAKGCSSAAMTVAKVWVIEAETLAWSWLPRPSSRRISPWTMKVSAPEVELWKGHANLPKLRGRPCSVR